MSSIYQNAYYPSNNFSQSQYENYLRNLCGNNSHDGYDYEQQFSFVYEQEQSYNQNYDDNYYSYKSPSFPCCDYCGGSHKNFQCQPIAQNIDFSGDDQIQIPQYPDVQKNPLTNDEFGAYTISNDANMNDLQFKLDNFQKNQQDFQEKFEQMQADLLNQMRNFMQNLHDGLLIPPPGEDKEHKATTDTELPSTEDIQPLPVREPAQESDIHQLIREECCVEVSEEQKRSMEDTMFELVKICQEKEFLCIHDGIDDLIERALDSKLLLINLNSQRLNKKEQEVKNVVEQPDEREKRCIQSLQNFREPEHLLNMRYEHLSITPETESDEVTESNAENLIAIPSECEVTLEDKREFYDDDFEDIKYVEASLSDLENVSIEEENNGVLREKLLSIIRLISNIESLNDNSTSNRVFNSFESDNSLLDNFSPEFKTFCDHTEQTRSGNTTHANYSFPEYDSFCFEIEPDQERLINLVKNDISVSSNESLLEEVNLFLSDDSIPPGINNFVDDPEGDIRFLEELLIDDSILSHESSNFEDNPSIPRPPPKPPDAETDAGE
nr:hypothetical protein [Tanacetum cinerariifolium]